MNNKDQENSKIKQQDVFNAILKTPEGKDFIGYIFDYCGLYRNTFSENEMKTFFNCGKQNVAQWLFEKCLNVNSNECCQLINNYKFKK